MCAAIEHCGRLLVAADRAGSAIAETHQRRRQWRPRAITSKRPLPPAGRESARGRRARRTPPERPRGACRAPPRAIGRQTAPRRAAPTRAFARLRVRVLAARRAQIPLFAPHELPRGTAAGEQRGRRRGDALRRLRRQRRRAGRGDASGEDPGGGEGTGTAAAAAAARAANGRDARSVRKGNLRKAGNPGLPADARYRRIPRFAQNRTPAALRSAD